jgi:hypothetical protein
MQIAETIHSRLPPKTPPQGGDPAVTEDRSMQSAEEEQADIERDIANVENESVERDGAADKPEPPIFEE